MPDVLKNVSNEKGLIIIYTFCGFLFRHTDLQVCNIYRDSVFEKKLTFASFDADQFFVSKHSGGWLL